MIVPGVANQRRDGVDSDSQNTGAGRGVVANRPAGAPTLKLC